MMQSGHTISISTWAVTTSIALFALVFGGGWVVKAAWAALRSAIREDLVEHFEPRMEMEKHRAALSARIDAVLTRVEDTENLVNDKLVSAVERFAVSIARLETLHEERHQQTQTTLTEIRDTLKGR